jgi:hypothetical protein
MKSVIKMSKAGIAALVFGIALTGCGGGSSSGSGSSQDTGGGQVVEGTAALSWEAPTQRQNGDSIEEIYELSGYIIKYGQDRENLIQGGETVRIDDAYTTEYSVQNLSDGTWYFSVQAEDNNGLVSPPSEVVSKKISG